MQVEVELDNLSATLGNNGISFKIYENDGSFAGDLRIGRATVEWMPGRTRLGNGIKIPLSRLLDVIEEVGKKPTR